MTTDQHVEITDLVPEWQRDLVYVDYQDGLTPEQVEEILHEGWSTEVDEWISDRQWDGAWELAGELLERNPGLLQERHDLADEIREIDTSNPYRDLMSNTGSMLFRVSQDEDDMVFLCDELESPADTLEALGLDPAFLPYVTEILPEIAGYKWEGGAHFGATFVFSANPSDLAWHRRVRITDPFLWLCNPWSGNGYGVVAEGCTITLDMEDIHVDKMAWGYSADDVFGGLVLPDSTTTPEET